MKTSLSLPETTMPLAREHAERSGMTVSAWIDRAVRSLAADEDVLRYEAWRETWSEEERATQDAFDAAAWHADENADL
jgi:hypothetical protein